eukprot:2487176-Pyramimonas_sp.AAC.1
MFHTTNACEKLRAASVSTCSLNARPLRTAYERGYAVVAITSQNRLSRCWHRQTDGPAVQLVFDVLRARQVYHTPWRRNY